MPFNLVPMHVASAVVLSLAFAQEGLAQTSASSTGDNNTSTSSATSAAPSTTSSGKETTISGTPIMQAIFGKSSPQESAAIGLGVSFTIIGLFGIFIGQWAWRKYRNRKKNAGISKDSEAGPPSMSRTSSCASSVCKPTMARRFSTNSERPITKPGILRRSSSQPSLKTSRCPPSPCATPGMGTRGQRRSILRNSKQYNEQRANADLGCDKVDADLLQFPGKVYDPYNHPPKGMDHQY